MSSPTVHEWEQDYLLKPTPIERCVQIEEVTKGAVMRWDLRPTDWHRIWPELRDRADAPKQIETSESGHVS